MKAFIAVLLEMGITRKPKIYSYWTKNSRSILWFKKYSKEQISKSFKIFSFS